MHVTVELAERHPGAIPSVSKLLIFFLLNCLHSVVETFKLDSRFFRIKKEVFSSKSDVSEPIIDLLILSDLHQLLNDPD